MIVYYIAIAFGRAVALLPFRLLYGISDAFAGLMRTLLPYRKKVIDHNLLLAFPEKTEGERMRIRHGFYRNFSDLLMESFKSLRISKVSMRKRYTLLNPELFEELYHKEKGILMVMGHYANFEWTAMSIPLLVPQKCYAVFHPLTNTRFNRLIMSIRQQFGLVLFPMEDTYPFMLNNADKRPLYVFMADQSPHHSKIKYRANFFNIPTPVHLGVENLARKCDLAVVFIDVQRVGRGRYTIEAKLLFEDADQTAEREITDTHVAELESVIRRKPEDWLWSHRRWKYA